MIFDLDPSRIFFLLVAAVFSPCAEWDDLHGVLGSYMDGYFLSPQVLNAIARLTHINFYRLVVQKNLESVTVPL